MKTIAIIIGISNYKDDAFEIIPGAEADANRFSSALRSWGLPQDCIYLILNEKATKANLVKTFCDCRPLFDTDAKLILYFAGHGIRENCLGGSTLESFLVCTDTESADLFSTAFRLVELMQLLRALRPTQAFLFIDACSLRLNEIENPLNDRNIFSTTNSKGLFCLFSSGIEKSYEDAERHFGYFTTALLKSLGELRLKEHPDCADIARKVTTLLIAQKFSPPEVYHIGLENMWPLTHFHEMGTLPSNKDEKGIVFRWEALGQLQDLLVSSPDPLIWIWGNRGMGKTIIAEQFSKTNEHAIYISIPTLAKGAIQRIIEQIRVQKAELFFNRPPEISLYPLISSIAQQQPDSILIFDHLDHLSKEDLKTLLAEIDRISLSTLLISRYPCPTDLFTERESKIIEWMTVPLNLDEIEQIVAKNNLDASFAAILLTASKGNPLEARQILAKLSGQEIRVKNKVTEEYIKSMTALAATGGFLDEHLFCNTFDLKGTTLATIEKLGLIRYTSNGCYPHDLLVEMVEENGWPLDFYLAALYWKEQIKHTPYNRWACQSLVMLVSQIEDCSSLKSALGQCQETLNDRELIRFLIDLVQIFQKHQWEDLLLKSSDYLIDHEEYQLAGDVLLPLLTSSEETIRMHASKNNARRLVWLGQFGESIQSNIEFLKTCQIPEVLIPLKNNIGIAQFFSGNLDIALRLFEDNIDSTEKKDEREIGIAKLMIGLIMTYRGEDVTKAKELLENSLQIFETTKYYLWIIVALNSLGDLSYRLEQWRQALYYINKAIDIAGSLQNKTFLLFSLKNAARVYLRLNGVENQELSMTVVSLEMVLQEVLETGHNWVTVWAYNVLATIYAHRNEIANLEAMIREVAPLTEHYKECHIFTLSNLGHWAVLTGDFERAIHYYESAAQLTQELNNPFALHEIELDFLGCNFLNFANPDANDSALSLHIQDDDRENLPLVLT